MHPNLSFLHFFSACFMYASPSLSNLLSSNITSLVSSEEAALTIHSSRRCWTIFLFRVLLYRWAHPAILVFNQRRAGRIILCMQPVPTSNGVAKSMTKRQWSPTPYLTGITHALATVTLLVAQMASIGMLPWKYVAPRVFAVKSPITSFIPRPCRSVNCHPSCPLYMFLFASRHSISHSPFFHHCFILRSRSSLNRVLGHVSSLSLLIRCRRCCWYTVPKSFFLFTQGEYPHMTRVTMLSQPLNFMYVHYPSPKSSRPESSESNCWIELPHTIIAVPPS